MDISNYKVTGNLHKMTQISTNYEWQSAVNWYSQIMGETGDELNRYIIRPTLLKMLGQLKGQVLLDVGCGSGYLTFELAQTAKKVVGVDFSADFINLCRTKYENQRNLSFEVYDATTKMEFDDQSFNIVLSKMVLQYIKDISIFAQESARVVKNNGKIVVVVDHPFHRQFYFAQSLAGRTGFSFDGLKGYFSRELQTKTKITADGKKIPLTWYPKTIADYIQPFIKAGLKLSDVKEVGENKEGTTIPRILFLEFKKN